MRIAIVGAGICGLTTALALANRGVGSTIFERSPRFSAVGAGIQLSPNALRALKQLDVLEDLESRGVEADTVALRSMGTGHSITKVPVASEDGTPYISVHRAGLQATLLESVSRTGSITLHTDAELSGIETRGSEIGLEIRSRTGQTRECRFDLVIAADGVRSRVAALHGLDGPVDSGRVAWRASIPSELAPPPPTITAWLASRRHAVAYPIDGGRSSNLVLIERPPGVEAPAGLGGRFSTRDRLLSRLIQAAEDVTPWRLLAVPAERPYRLRDDQLILVGDAAHAMLPYAAQGAALAIEDGVTLAEVLVPRQGDLRARLDEWEMLRRRRVERVRARVAFHAFAYHLPQPFALGRNAVLAVRSPASLRHDLAWIYDWQPPT